MESLLYDQYMAAQCVITILTINIMFLGKQERSSEVCVQTVVFAKFMVDNKIL